MKAKAHWRNQERLANPPLAKTHGLLEPGVEAIPVRITIVQDDVETGWDDGAMGFEETTVWFSGRACSFHIAAPDILPGTYRLSRHQAVTTGEALQQGLPLKHDSREVWIRIKVLKMEERNDWEDEETLARSVQRLRAETQGREPSEYPPLAPRPGMLKTYYLPAAPYRILLGCAAITLSLFGQALPFGKVLGALSGGIYAYLWMAGPNPNDPKLRRIAAAEANE